MEIIKSEEQEENRLKKSELSLEVCEIPSCGPTYALWDSQKKIEKRYLNKLRLNTFQN